MVLADRKKQLDVLVEVSRRMQESAESGDWETVNHIQEKIQQLAGGLFAEIDTTADVEQLTEAVNEILKINQCVVEMGVEARDGCLEELDQLQQGRAAVKEYTANTG